MNCFQHAVITNYHAEVQLREACSRMRHRNELSTAGTLSGLELELQEAVRLVNAPAIQPAINIAHLQISKKVANNQVDGPNTDRQMQLYLFDN